LTTPKDIVEYTIRDGTKVICDPAFNEAAERARAWAFHFDPIGLRTLFIPSSVTIISELAFRLCLSIKTIYIPMGTRTRFEELLPQHVDKLVELYEINEKEGWKVKERRAFTQDEIYAVKRTEVVSSKFGYSVCFVMVSGGQTYIPLVNYSTLAVGDSIELINAKLITLCRKGDDDIYRVEA
jgi:hypothetical protein